MKTVSIDPKPVGNWERCDPPHLDMKKWRLKYVDSAGTEQFETYSYAMRMMTGPDPSWVVQNEIKNDLCHLERGIVEDGGYFEGLEVQ